METIACFKTSGDANAALNAITGDGVKAAVKEFSEQGIFALRADGVGPAPESLPNFSEVATAHNAITCEQCASPEVEYPSGAGEKWVLPQIAAKLKNAVTESGTNFQCRKCDLEWSA